MRTMDMVKLDIADGSLDGIISFYSIIHTPRRFVKVLFRGFNRVLKKHGKILVVVKKGETEGFINELEGFKTNLYFTNFKETEIEDYLKVNGFKVVSLKTRQPYDFEIHVDRIYAIGEKTASV